MSRTLHRVTAAWAIEHTSGDTAAFHARTDFAGRMAIFHEVEHPTLVLGSAQRQSDVEARVADALGIDVVGRRSGGGAVLVMPGETLWLDLVVPAGDPLWSDDVSEAMQWVGEVWRSALGSVGVECEVHRGALVAGEWGRRVCFASTGSGEVVHGAAKLVGVSQRRTRHWARFQTMCHLRWRPELVAALLTPPRPAPSVLAAAVVAVRAQRERLASALLAELATR